MALTWKKIKKKYKPHVAALAILASSAATGCIQQANQEHKEIIDVIATYEVPQEQEREVIELAQHLNGGEIHSTSDLRALKKELHLALEVLPRDTHEHQFYQALSAVCTQLSNYTRTLDSITRSIDAVKHGRASDNVFNDLVIGQVHELNSSTQGLGFGQLLDILVYAKDAGYQFVFFEKSLVDYFNAISSQKDLVGQVDEGQLHAVEKEFAQQQHVVSRTLQKL